MPTTDRTFEPQHVDSLDPKDRIIVKGARVNNLKNLDVAVIRNSLTVVTGLSGSGKSSLAFDTLYAEGQRMYVESLSAYARQFLGRMEKPEADYIKGVSPAIAVEQKVTSRNPRSTVGTTTEIYDYLKLLFARIGTTYSPVSGKPVKKDTVSDVTDHILTVKEGSGYMILAPLLLKKGRKPKDALSVLLQQGFTRVWTDNRLFFIEEILEEKEKKKLGKEIFILIDRNVAPKSPTEDDRFRIADSVQTAFFEGEGHCIVIIDEKKVVDFSDRFEADGIVFEEPSVNLFTFNNPYGACKRCEGFGRILGIDEDLVIPDKKLSVFEGAVAPWRSDKMKKWLQPLLKSGIEFDFPIHRPVIELTNEQKQLLWTGNEYFEGLDAFFNMLESKSYEIQYRVMLSRYRGRTDCPDCRGTRLRKDASYVKIGGKSITDLVLMSVNDIAEFFDKLKLSKHDAEVAKRILNEIKHRLNYLEKVGLGYLTLNRLTSSLSGGEYQRIRLATSLGSALVGSMYILDEPSIGLHPRDTRRLIEVLKYLRDLGNTVIVVEHEEEIMRSADEIIDIGPDAGTHGGELVFQGSITDDSISEKIIEGSHTLKYLLGRDTIEVPKKKRPWSDFIEIKGAHQHNLKNIDVKFPLNTLTVITGVSGSGKSTLVREILLPALKKTLGEYGGEATGKFAGLEGCVDRLTGTEFIDQNPIGKSSRSNPVTYVKAYDAIRELYAGQQLAKARGYKPAKFSFNVDGGRCDECKGDGIVKIEMQFMADLKLTCESCEGKRFKEEILDVKFNEASISDVLEMTVDDSMAFFADQPKVLNKIKPLQDVGLGYIRLGQSSDTLSGGEAQRVKLASFFDSNSRSKERLLFIFDEPTTGLHFHDIKKLLAAMNTLVDQGHSVIVIEHNTEVIKCADHVIDLGPEGGDAGGNVVFAGTPEELVKQGKGHTAGFLRGRV